MKRKTPSSTFAGRRMTGLTLIEVMISVLILGVGMLGIAAMQTTALRNNQSALQRSQAVIQTYTIIDAMRANRNEAMLDLYNTGGKLCNAPASNNLIIADKQTWIKGLKDALGNFETTCGEVACASGSCVVTVYWDDSRATNIESEEKGVASTAQSVMTRVRL